MSTSVAGLNTRCVIQRRTGGTNDWGEPLPEGWETHATVWASVKHLSGSEAIKADAEVSTVRASIRIRFRSDITAGMRVLIGLTVYQIEAVMPDLARREFVDLVVVRSQYKSLQTSSGNTGSLRLLRV